MWWKRLVAQIIIFSGVLLVAILYPIFNTMIIVYIGGAVSAIGLIIGWIIVRCPECNHSLPIWGWFYTNCPYCGADL